MLKGLQENLLLSKFDSSVKPWNLSLCGRSNRKKRTAFFLAASFVLVSLSSGIVPPITVSAVTNIPSGNGATWEIQDASAPGLDTGSIRTVSGSSVQGFGNIFVRVSGKSVSGKTEPLFNGQMMRGFGLEFDGKDTFETTQAVDLGGVHITRDIQVDPVDSWTRYFDSFT